MAGEIQIPGVDFGALAQEAIAHQITKALVGADKMVDTIIAAALSQKVDAEGKAPRYPDDKSVPYISWLAHDLVRKALKDALVKKVAEMQPDLEVAVVKALKASVPAMAHVIVEQFTKQAQTPHFAVTMELKSRY